MYYNSSNPSSSAPIAIPTRSSPLGSEAPTPPPLRLQTRRGSRSAPDPWSLGPLTSSASANNSTNNVADTTVAGTYGPTAFFPSGGAGGGSGISASPGPASIYNNSLSGMMNSTSSSTASRITIMRVQQDTAVSPLAEEFAQDVSSLGGGAGPEPHSRPGRSSSWGSNYSNTSNPSSGGGGRSHSPGASRRSGVRKTFAFPSSFTPINPPAPSPTAERPNRDGLSRSGSSSSQYHRHHPRSYSNSNMQPVKPSLTAQQIYDLAMSSTSPSVGGVTASMTPPHTGNDLPDHPSSANSTAPASPATSYGLHRSSSRSRPTTPGLTSSGSAEKLSPAVFRPMPDEVYLPFVDRPQEVSALLSEPPTSRLFMLLEALFPADMKHNPTPQDTDDYPQDDDPTKWTFERLSKHLRETTRAEMDDKAWTDAVRACVRGRSEALWERFKGALGVPVELELPGDGDDDLDGEDALMSHSLLLEDFRAGGGVVTPGTAPPSEYLNGPESDGGAGPAFSMREAILEPVFADQRDSDQEDEDEDEDGEGARRLNDAVGAASGTREGLLSNFSNLSSGALSDGGWSSGRVMENIGEGEEDEDDHEREAYEPVEDTTLHDDNKRHSHLTDFNFSGSPLFTPGREIRALQITTAPFLSSPSLVGSPAGTGVRSRSPKEELAAFTNPAGHNSTDVPSQSAPIPEEGLASTTVVNVIASDQTGMSGDSIDIAPLEANTSEGSSRPPPSNTRGPRVVLRRPSETIGQTLRAKGDETGGEASSYEGFGGYGLAPTNRPYHPALSERGPGNPLFPSSFADLSVAPTLLANVPKASRSASVSHSSLYPSILSPSRRNMSASLDAEGNVVSQAQVNAPNANVRRRRSMNSRATLNSTWALVRDRHEYAVTVASASSDGGRG